jgi:putative hydrolase of the HAD superfamily
MIKNIIFDLGGVLLDIDLPYCMRSVQALGIDFNAMSAQTSKDASTTSAGMKPAVMGEGLVANGALHLYQIGGISTEDFLSGIQQLCHPGTTRQQVIDAWNTCCIGIPQYRLEKVKQLRQQGYRIHMLSNTNDAHWQDIVNRCFGGQDIVNQLFEHVFLSQEMHMAKPNDDIYLQVLDTLQSTAGECLFIDDSTPNIQAAAALGFHTIHAEVSQTRNGEVIAPPQNDWTRIIDEVLQQQ